MTTIRLTDDEHTALCVSLKQRIASDLRYRRIPEFRRAIRRDIALWRKLELAWVNSLGGKRLKTFADYRAQRLASRKARAAREAAAATNVRTVALATFAENHDAGSNLKAA